MDSKQDASLPPYSQQPYQQTPQMSSITPQRQAYPPQPILQQPIPQAVPPQAIPPQAYQQGQQPLNRPPYQGQQYVPPAQLNQRNEALIAQYRQEIADNEIGCAEIWWFLCCGVFGFICCLPKYNAQQRAKTNLKIELAKAPGQP
ncbi:hypothetical protein BGX21_005528 [Mortierella sp. AD011]|nr:hypothetical protein BGX20_005882 [Mortierella sp. AD010]KAF9399844.1 hypothetical protein BGX21_005528 [Mortierella sp. AD011]